MPFLDHLSVGPRGPHRQRHPGSPAHFRGPSACPRAGTWEAAWPPHRAHRRRDRNQIHLNGPTSPKCAGPSASGGGLRCPGAVRSRAHIKNAIWLWFRPRHASAAYVSGFGIPACHSCVSLLGCTLVGRAGHAEPSRARSMCMWPCARACQVARACGMSFVPISSMQQVCGGVQRVPLQPGQPFQFHGITPTTRGSAAAHA